MGCCGCVVHWRCRERERRRGASPVVLWTQKLTVAETHSILPLGTLPLVACMELK
ncbi:hypothetical protein TMEC54S_01777 [Thauera mechernichensis]